MYTKIYFNKEIDKVFYEDVENFFLEEKEESNKIEFKSFYQDESGSIAKKEEKIIETICAFLNSEGGLIIWGAPKGIPTEGRKEKIYQGELSPVNERIEKDAFITRISDLITPTPRKINFQRCEKNNNYVYLIEVEASLYSPHQFRNKYFMRIDAQTRPAPHHYIEALFKKITYPRLEGYLKFKSIEVSGHTFMLNFYAYLFNCSKLLNEFDIYYRIMTTVGTFTLSNLDGSRILDRSGKELRSPNAKSTLYYDEPIFDPLTIQLPTKELAGYDNKIDMYYFFAGRQSPLLVSNYRIEVNPSEINFKIISKEENLIPHEQENAFSSHEERIKKILGQE